MVDAVCARRTRKGGTNFRRRVAVLQRPDGPGHDQTGRSLTALRNADPPRRGSRRRRHLAHPGADFPRRRDLSDPARHFARRRARLLALARPCGVRRRGRRQHRRHLLFARQQPRRRRHVANCGYVVAPDAFGRGVARAMCAHSLDQARERGFTAMQFNFVIASNERAVRLWQSLGFAIVGRLPGPSATRGWAPSTPM